MQAMEPQNARPTKLIKACSRDGKIAPTRFLATALYLAVWA